MKYTALAQQDVHAHREEIANAWTHGIGVLGSVAGSAVLIVLTSRRGSPWGIVAVCLFGASLITLYLASTLYHASRNSRVKARLKVFDHAAIYFLIAGTYTPFTLLGLRGGWGWSLFGVIWALAAAGVVFKLFHTGRFPRLSTSLYLGMGWLIIIAALPLFRAVSPATLGWLIAGGLAYSAGTIFYHNQRVPYAHAIWHCFVLAGSICHYTAVLLHAAA